MGERIVTPAHHPQAETLLSFAAGALTAGPRLVVATHIAGCPECRRVARGFEAVGGALLEAAPAAQGSPELLMRALGRLEAASAPRGAAGAPPPPRPPDLHDIPAPLRHHAIGPWRRVAPGFRISRVAIPEDRAANVILLRVGAGCPVPRHTHEGVEYTQVLSGAFSDVLGHYGPGDCIEAGDDVDHQPIVDLDGECICLAAVEGRLRLHSFVARLIQPFFGL
jgi:putative transcriptional regulator